MSSLPRYPIFDLLRGIAIVLMVYFHFCFDLAYFGYIEANFYRDPYWLHLRTLIVSMFLLLVGISLVMATRQGIDKKRYFRRLGLLILFSLIISINSHFMFPGRTVYIGILHFIAIASVLGLLFLKLYYLNLVLGISLIVLDLSFKHPFFDQPWIHWLGLMTHKPYTEDYVPLIPWFGVVLIGMFIGQTVIKRPGLSHKLTVSWDNPGARLITLAGQNSLLIYVVHQPVLFGSLWLINSL